MCEHMDMYKENTETRIDLKNIRKIELGIGIVFGKDGQTIT